MKTLFFALRLRMVRSAVRNADPVKHQPHAQLRVQLRSATAPGPAVVTQDSQRLTITLQQPNQGTLHRLGSLVGTSNQSHVVTRMIVQHRQRMTSTSVQHRHVSLEIHLPQLVGMGLFKMHECPMLRRLRRIDQAMPQQDLTDRAG